MIHTSITIEPDPADARPYARVSYHEPLVGPAGPVWDVPWVTVGIISGGQHVTVAMSADQFAVLMLDGQRARVAFEETHDGAAAGQ